jgi:PHD/YefM family antitoxin component YafN of YafNO toxin-antitoxin module
MTVAEVLKAAQFVVDQEGKPTAVMLDMSVWNALLEALENVEDAEIVRERLKNWRTKQGWTRWEDFEAELDADELSSMDRQ